MLSFILSIIVFAVPAVICYFGYLYNKKELERIKFELEIEKETSKNLEYIFYNMLKR